MTEVSHPRLDEAVHAQPGHPPERQGVANLFNPAAEEIPEAMSIRFNQMVYDLKRAGRDVVVLSLGEAYFDIPLFDLKALDYVKGYHYSESQGIPDLREKIAKFYGCQYGVPVDPRDELLISAGSKPLIFMSLLALLQAGEEIAVHEPCWLSYPHQARLCGARTRFIPANVGIEDFVRYLSPRTRVLILNNPNNPSGRIYRVEELTRLFRMCSGRGMYLVVDEAYSDFVLDGSFTSVGRLVPTKDHIIIVNSLSKNMGMSGWRVGYVIAHPEVIKVILKINQHLITCAPTILLQYCSKYFDDILACTLPQVRAVVEKRARIAEVMASMGLESLPGGATFYFFVSLGSYPGGSIEFATELLKRHAVAVVPGAAYGNSTDRYVRVSIGAEPEARIVAALQCIVKLINETRATGSVFTTEQELEHQPPPDPAAT